MQRGLRCVVAHYSGDASGRIAPCRCCLRLSVPAALSLSTSTTRGHWTRVLAPLDGPRRSPLNCYTPFKMKNKSSQPIWMRCTSSILPPKIAAMVRNCDAQCHANQHGENSMPGRSSFYLPFPTSHHTELCPRIASFMHSHQ